MRLLVIDDDAEYRRLLRHHVSCTWPRASFVEYDPRVRGPLAPEIRAHGFDAVLLDHAWAGGAGLAWLEELLQRPGFAPVLFLAARSDDDSARRARELGACAVLGKDKIEHAALIAAVGEACERQARARTARTEPLIGFDPSRFSGAHIPGYRRVRRLATRQISDLYLAESESVPELVVIKVARDKLRDNELDRAFRHFLQEHEIVRRMRDPSVVRLYDLGFSDEHAYLVMEYFRRGDLRRRMRSGLTAVEALRFALQTAQALEVIHKAGVLHRDLKPSNIMLREDGGLALIDFGLALHETLGTGGEERGVICGTPHYMSPEQGHGEPIDARSDLYSLGIVLYEMLTGQKPYVAENSMTIIYMHKKAPLPVLPAALAPLQSLVSQLLAKDPAQRFGSASAAADALAVALRELGATDLAA